MSDTGPPPGDHTDRTPADWSTASQPRLCSRRQLLAGVAAIGVGAATGVGTAARLHDTESGAVVATAGTVDIEAHWHVDPGTPETLRTTSQLGRGTASVGVPARTAATPTNPAHLWMRTPCAPDCAGGDGLWSRLDVRVVDRRDGQQWHGSLCAVLTRLSDGVYLGRIDPGETREVSVEWRLTAAVDTVESLPFTLEFYAAQFRQNDDAADETPNRPTAWDGPVERCASVVSAGPTPDISFVAFCGAGLSSDELSLTLHTTDGRTTAVSWHLDGTAAARVDEVVLKYDTRFEVFDTPPATVRVGHGDGVVSLFESVRTPANPCPDSDCTLKYEVDEDAWERRGCEPTARARADE